MDTTDYNDWSQSAMVELSVAKGLFRGYTPAPASPPRSSTSWLLVYFFCCASPGAVLVANSVTDRAAGALRRGRVHPPSIVELHDITRSASCSLG